MTGRTALALARSKVTRSAGWIFKVVAAVVVVLPAVHAGAAERPNVVVILADDMGYAEVGAYGAEPDVRTPNLDRMAAEGVRCTAGYVTAPQCSPSRAGLLTGRYQQRFALDSNVDTPLAAEAVTLAERLKAAGYVTGHVGKWHLEPGGVSREWARRNLPEGAVDAEGRVKVPFEAGLRFSPGAQGFDLFFNGTAKRYHANYDLTSGEKAAEPKTVDDARFRVDVQSDAAVAFVERHHAEPFFLYVAYYAPHVPLEATEEDLARFPGAMSERRRHALAMTAAIDDGVGRIWASLSRHGLDEKTLVVFTSDNGAPLQGKEELPVEAGGATWNGSLNTPWVGEKGTLMDGGVRVPFLMRRKGTLPPGVYDRPVSTLDIAATAVAAAGLPRDAALDGVDLAPYLTEARAGEPHEALYWRFLTQSAVRAGNWKYLRAGDRAEYLFDLGSPDHETKNVLAEHPEVADGLRAKLASWAGELTPPGLPGGTLRRDEKGWYGTHLGLPQSSVRAGARKRPPRGGED